MYAPFTFFGLFLNFLHKLSASPLVKSTTSVLDRSLNGAWIGPGNCRCGLGFRLAPKEGVVRLKARYSRDVFTLYINGYPLLSDVPLPLPLRIKVTP